MKRIIILLKNGMGDVIMAIPLLRVCKDSLGNKDRLLILVKSITEKTIVEYALSMDERIEIVCIGKLWSGSKFSVLKLGSQLRRFRPTLFLLPQATNRLGITAFSLIVGAAVTVLPHSNLNRFLFRRTVKRSKKHKMIYYLRFGKIGGLNTDTDFRGELSIPKHHLTEAKALLRSWESSQKWIGFVPGSGIIEAHKRWPISSYRSLGKKLLNRGPEFRIAIFGSPSENDLVNEIKRSLNTYSARVVSIVEPNIMIAAGAISHCACLVSGCSGAVHLAAAVGTPVIGLYGPTNPGFTGPLFNKVRIVREGLKCSPCYRVGFIKGCGNPVCMSMIESDVVEKEVMLALRGKFDMDISWCPTTKAVKPDIMIKSVKQ